MPDCQRRQIGLRAGVEMIQKGRLSELTTGDFLIAQAPEEEKSAAYLPWDWWW